MKRKGFCVLLTLCMVLTCMPFGVFANTDSAVDESGASGYSGGLADPVTAAEKEAADNDDRLSLYLEKRLKDGSDSQVGLQGLGRDLRTNLSDTSAAVYDILEAGVEKIANGERSSTDFSISFPNDLGLTIHAEGPTIEDGCEKASEQVDLDLEAVIRVLMANCPYELYWYDKTQDTVNGFSYSVQYYDESGPFDATVVSLYIKFPVAEEYAGNKQYTVDQQKMTAIQTAVDAISGIVAENSALSDYAKLRAYKEKICELTSYNSEAAGNQGVPYGNPWQLIWVFDGDSSTNVVCEGYSKAFQYLCDLSEFSGDIYCYSAAGTMNSGNGAAAHMWNIVHMNDGSNYLVDVTNCDEGMFGAPDLLFLAGASEGSCDTGYTFSCKGGTVLYKYDSPYLKMYSEEERTLSMQDYSEDTQEYEVRVVSALVGLEDYINVKFLLSNLGAGDAADFTVKYRIRGKENAVKLSDCPLDEKGRFTVSVPVVAKEMTEPIEVWVENASGKVISNTVSYSVETYCLNKIKSDSSEQKLKDLCAAILNYGAFAQAHFGYNEENPANRELAACGYSASVPDIAVPENTAVKEGETEGIAAKSASLGLEAATVLHFRFRLDEGSSIDDYTFTCGNRTLQPVLTGTDAGQQVYTVDITGIAAKNMDNSYTVKVTKNGKGTLSVTYSVLTYLYSKQNVAAEGLGNLCKTMYNYHLKANDYFRSY